VTLAHNCGVVQGRDVRVLRCLGKLAGVREPRRGEHEQEVSERACCARAGPGAVRARVVLDGEGGR
jgi:hypothetical protein